jgi:hypothetical protein
LKSSVPVTGIAAAANASGHCANDAEYLIGYEGDAFAYTGDIVKDLLSITAVHPMRKEAVEAFLLRDRAPWEVVERLVAQGDLRETNYDGHCFYLRRFNFLQDPEHL